MNKEIISRKSRIPCADRYNNLKMLILDRLKIGDSVKVNLEESKDRLTKEIIDTINVSSVGKISEFRITDGRGFGVILELYNGKEQWFFENEIDLIDENGNVIKKINYKKEKNIFIFEELGNLKYENKKKFAELINPINFFLWLTVSLKDIF